MSRISETIEETHSFLERLNEKVNKLLAKVQNLENIVSGINKYPVHSEYKLNSLHPCHEKGEFPHLFHTENPQLNNISDMLVHIHDCCCKEIETINNNSLRELINSLKEQGRGKYLLDPLDQLYNLIEDLKEKQQHRCITIEDLEKLLEKREKQSQKETERPLLLPPPHII